MFSYLEKYEEDKSNLWIGANIIIVVKSICASLQVADAMCFVRMSPIRGVNDLFQVMLRPTYLIISPSPHPESINRHGSSPIFITCNI